jgi:hypothetical protein
VGRGVGVGVGVGVGGWGGLFSYYGKISNSLSLSMCLRSYALDMY